MFPSVAAVLSEKSEISETVSRKFANIGTKKDFTMLTTRTYLCIDPYLHLYVI
jgi:hypothetical protein